MDYTEISVGGLGACLCNWRDDKYENLKGGPPSLQKLNGVVIYSTRSLVAAERHISPLGITFICVYAYFVGN